MSNAMERVLAARPPRVIEKLGASSKICLLSSREVFQALMEKSTILMASNIRIRHVIPGIMRAAKELNTVALFEIAKSEGDVDGGYTGLDPDTFFQTVVEYADELAFDPPLIIHGDHITVKDTSDKAVESGMRLVQAELDAGFTSFAVDASFNVLEDNLRITEYLSKPIQEAGYGLEVEVGEIKSAGQEGDITTVAEAEAFIGGLRDRGIYPNLLAVNNGSKHGNYLDGEEVRIDLERTWEIYKAVRPMDAAIAQHGITGTPMNVVGRFADYGIRKGNVGTQWQNIAHAGLPKDLMDAMRKWAEEQGQNIKMATKPFKSDIDSIDKRHKDAIAQSAYESALEYFRAFRAEGIAAHVIETLAGK